MTITGKIFPGRFAVGSPSGLRSSVWRVWNNDNDVYFTVRALGGIKKVSLHESGQYQFSFTSEYHQSQKTNEHWQLESRHTQRWQRPLEISPSLTLVFRIIIPASELRSWPTEIPKNKPITWIESPPQDTAIEFDIFLSNPDLVVSTWPGANAMKTKLLVRNPLPNGEIFWIVYRMETETQAIEARIENARSRLSIKSDELDSQGLRMILFTTEADGSRSLIEAAADMLLNK